MATTVRTLVAGQNTTVGAVSSRSLYTIAVASGTPGSSGANGANGVSVTSANAATGNLIFTLSNSATIDAGPLNIAANLSGYQTAAGLSANVATLTSNNTSFVGSVSAANVVSNAQLSSNLANYATISSLSSYQTTAGLSANVATLTSNNASYLGGIAANQYAYANATVDRLTSNGYTAVLQANGKLTLANGLNTSVNNSITINTSRQRFEWITAIAGSGANTLVANTSSNTVVLDVDTEWLVLLGYDEYPITAIATSYNLSNNDGTVTLTIPGLTVQAGLPYLFKNPTPVPKAWEFDKTGGLTFPDETTQTTAFTEDYDTLTTGFPRIPRSTATNAIHAVDISTVNTNRDGILIYDTNGSRVRMFANGTGWYTFATTDDVAAVDRLTSNGFTAVLESNGTLATSHDVYSQYFSVRGGYTNGTIGSLGYNGDIIDLYGVNGVTISTVTEGGPQWLFGTDGVLTTSGNAVISTPNNNVNTSFTFTTNLNAPGAAPPILNERYQWKLDHDGTTYIPATIVANDYVSITGTFGGELTFTDSVDSSISGTISIRKNGSETTARIEASGNGTTGAWEFSSDRTMMIPGTIITDSSHRIELNPNNDANAYIRVPTFDDGGERMEFMNQYAGSYGFYFYTEGGHTFRMYQNQLGFPDSTWQTTAFTGDANNASYLGGVAAASYQTTAGLSANVATLTSNNTLYLGGSAANTYAPINNPTFTGNVTGNTAGFTIGYLDVPQNYTNTSFTIGLSDRGKHIFTSNGTSQTITIANNTSVAFPIGTAISIVSQGAGTITVARGTGVTLYLAANSTSADRTIASYGMATLLKVATNTWFINGAGVS